MTDHTANPAAQASEEPVTETARRKAVVEPILERLIDMYVDGMSIRQIIDELRIPLTQNNLRLTILYYWPEIWEAARVARSHELIERNAEYAINAAGTGEASGFKAAAEINFKLAAIYNADEFGEKKKVELTGKNGGPIETKADLTLTPDEAYKRLLGGEA